MPPLLWRGRSSRAVLPACQVKIFKTQIARLPAHFTGFRSGGAAECNPPDDPHPKEAATPPATPTLRDSGFPRGKRPDESPRSKRGGRRKEFSWVPLDRTHPVFPPGRAGGPGRAGTGTEAGAGEKSGRADTEGGFGIAERAGVPARAGAARQLPPPGTLQNSKIPPPGVLISML